MSRPAEDLAPYLAPTEFVESEHPDVRAVVERLGLARREPRERAAEAFRFVRDEIRYEFVAKLSPDWYRASRVLREGRGFCVQKAVLLCAVGRAAGLPTALVVSDLRDYTLPAPLVAAMKTDVMHHHGLNAFHLDGRWLRVDATLSPDLVARRGFRRVDFDGTAEALLSPTTAAGEPHTEYLAFHGRFPDFCMERLLQSFAKGYAQSDLSTLGKLIVRD